MSEEMISVASRKEVKNNGYVDTATRITTTQDHTVTHCIKADHVQSNTAGQGGKDMQEVVQGGQ